MYNDFDMRLSYFTKDESFPFFIQYGSHDSNMFVHGHADFSELVVVLEGRATHVVDSERYEIKKGDVFVMGDKTRHGYENPEDFRICNLMFRPESLLAGDYDVKRLAGFHALFLLESHYNNAQGFQSRLKLAPDNFFELEKLINAAIAEYEGENGGKKTMLISYFLQIVVMLSRLYGCVKKHREIDSIASAAAYMENHYMEDIEPGTLLEVSHYSQRHFIRLFSETYHTTPQKYLLGIRIRRACSLLRDSGIPVTEIATRCGFNDSNYFSRIFKKYTNVTPSTFRSNIIS